MGIHSQEKGWLPRALLLLAVFHLFLVLCTVCAMWVRACGSVHAHTYIFSFAKGDGNSTEYEVATQGHMGLHSVCTQACFWHMCVDAVASA